MRAGLLMLILALAQVGPLTPSSEIFLTSYKEIPDFYLALLYPSLTFFRINPEIIHAWAQ